MNVLELKAAVRARDGYACTQCGKHSSAHIEETGRNLDVHRVTPGSTYSTRPARGKTV